MLATTHNHELTSNGASGDIRAEFQALVSGCAIYDLSSQAKIKLTGNDRVRWLNGMVTNNVRDLATGHGVYSFLLSPQGRILGDLYAYNRGDSIWLNTDQSQAAKILEIFDHYIIMDDVEVENLSDKLTAIGISGPKSLEILRAAGLEMSDLQPLELRDCEWRQIPLTIVRGDREKRESFEIWATAENVEKLGEVLKQGGAIAVSPGALELHRISLGIPRYGQDIRERDMAQETEQARALNFSKGCYVGQEIVERIRSRGAVHRTFTGFLIEGDLPAIGTKIQESGKDVGEITSVANLPVKSNNQNVALGYIRREAGSSGKEFLAGGVKVAVAELPFKVVFG
jgi:folate-binding protein YgfZ